MFTKGQNVKLISSWGRKGGVSWMVRKAIVASCGKKQMNLIDGYTLKPIGGFKPQEDQWAGAIVKDCSMEQAQEIALAKAQEQRTEEIERINRALSHMNDRTTDPFYIDSLRKDLREMEAATVAVVTPYEPGHEYGPKADTEQYKPGPAPKKYVARYNGAIVGERRSHRTYTHAIVVETETGPKAFNWSGSLALAQKASTQSRGSKVLAIVDAEVV